MNPEYFRKFARQCRELLQRANTDKAKEQLRVWADEFDAEAATLERGLNTGSRRVVDSC